MSDGDPTFREPRMRRCSRKPERVSSATKSMRRGSASLLLTVGFLSSVKLRPVRGEPCVELGQPLGVHERL